MSPRVALILINIAVFCTGCVCPGPCYGPAVCRPQAYGPAMPAAQATMARPLLPRPILPRPFASQNRVLQNQITAAPAVPRAPRFRRHAADWPEALPISYERKAASPVNRQKLRLVQKTNNLCQCETSSGLSRTACSDSSCSHCDDTLPARSSCAGQCKGQCKGQCRCHSHHHASHACQSCQTTGTGCTDCRPLPTLGLPHHQPVFSGNEIPPAYSSAMPTAESVPVDVTSEADADAAPDVLEGKSVNDVVPAPIPPPDPKPAPMPKDQRFDTAEPPAPSRREFSPTEEPSPEPLDAEDPRLDPQPVPEIQPIALWIPATNSPVTRPTVEVEPNEIIVLPGTRLSSKRIQ